VVQGGIPCHALDLGSLLIMLGQHARSEALFYYFRLEDQVPENHLLRLVEKHISFAFVCERLRESYSETGRPSIDPELLLRILLIGYLYGITSERKLVEELRMHLAWRWFTGLGFDQEIPHHHFRSETQFDPCISSITLSMLTSSNSPVKRSGTPSQFLGVLFHTMAMFGVVVT